MSAPGLDVADLRFVFAIVPLVLGLLQLQTTLSERRRWTERADQELGPFGRIYYDVNRRVNRCLRVLLTLLCGVAVWAFIQGAALTDTLSFDDWVGRWLFDNSPWLAILWLFLALTIQSNWLPRLYLSLIRWRNPLADFSPDVVTTYRHLDSGDKAIALNVSRTGTRIVAERVFHLWRERITASDNSASSPPESWSRQEVANYYFIECIIEGELTILGKRLSNWSTLFTALIEAKAKQEDVFSPSLLRRSDPKGYYQRLSTLVQSPALPDEVAVAARVSEALEVLGRKWEGNAQELARTGAPGFTPWSVRKVAWRLGSISGFREDGREAIRAQFMKLCVEDGVWPGMDPGLYVVPVTVGIAKLLFDNGVVVVPSAVSELQMTPDVQRVVARAEYEIAREVVSMASIQPLLTRQGRPITLSPGQRSPLLEVVTEVDFILWLATDSVRKGTPPWPMPDLWQKESRALRRRK